MKRLRRAAVQPDMSTDTSARLGFPNALNTCYMGALLQGLFALPELVPWIAGHICAGGCSRDCPLRALDLCEANSRAASHTPPTVIPWEYVLKSWGMTLYAQQDPHEVLIKILVSLPPQMQELFRVHCLTHGRRTVCCTCPQSKSFSNNDAFTHVELGVPSERSTLQQVVDELSEWGRDMDTHCEHCGEPGIVQHRRETMPAGKHLVVTLSRYMQDAVHMPKDVPPVVPKKRTQVDVPVILLHGGCEWTLKAIVVHRGVLRDSGHYVAVVRNEVHWDVYDDEARTSFQELPNEVATDGVLFFYSRSEEWQPQLKIASPAKVGAAAKPPPPPAVPRQAAVAAPPGELPHPSAMQGRQTAESLTDWNITAASVAEADASALPSNTEARRCMDITMSDEVVQQHVDDLLAEYRAGRSCEAFLAKLPTFVAPGPLESLDSEFDTATRMLLLDRVTSAAALQVRPYIADTMVYPLYILLRATAVSQSMPPEFYIDVFHCLLHSVFNKHLHVKMGRYESKSRHWMVGTANVGEGKSPGLKVFMDAMIEVLTENVAFAVGEVDDRFHYQQSGTTPGAIEKLQTCRGYLCIYCPDGGRCLSPTAATTGNTDPYKHIDLEWFLDAAHGDEFNHSNMTMRAKLAKSKAKNPGAAVGGDTGMHIDPTNVHVLLLQQDVVFASYWAQLTSRKPVGLAQRCLFSFGGDADPAPIDLKAMLLTITKPFVKKIFCMVVRHVGPVVTQTEHPYIVTTEAQNNVVCSLESTIALHKRNPETPEAFRGALPKAMYWLGTSILHNVFAEAAVAAVLNGSDALVRPSCVSDAAFAASVRFSYRRYLPGQAVLTETIRAKSWLTREIPLKIVPGDLTPTLVRILRGCKGNTITRRNILEVDLDLKRDMLQGCALAMDSAERKLQELWRMMVDLGVGVVCAGIDGQMLCRKYERSSLSKLTLTWLQQNRIPGHLFGLHKISAEQLPDTSTKGPRLHGTNPCNTVRASSQDLANLCSAMGGAIVRETLPSVQDETLGPLAGAAAAEGKGNSEATHFKRKYKVGVLNNLHCNEVQGILLTRATARKFIRDELVRQHLVVKLEDVKTKTHQKWFSFKG